jgi:cytochrome c551/c552
MTPPTLRAALLAGLACNLVSAAAPDAQIRRGAYLTRIMGCADCHMPMKMGPKGPEPDEARGLSGHPEALVMPAAPAPKGPWLWSGAATNTAFAGPWGVSYAANLTPDDETGLGRWTEAQFLQIVRTGRHLGKGRAILPPMPIQSLRATQEEDLKAIFAYLRSQPAVRNHVPAATEPVPSH